MLERMRKQHLTTAVGLLTLVFVAGCTTTTRPEADEPPESPAPPATINITPADGTRDRAPSDGVTVVAARGRLTTVSVTNADGDRLEGAIAENGLSWSTDATLAFNTSYRVMATAANPDGEITTTLATFRTANPRALLHTAIVPLDGETVGVGLPIQVQLSAAVRDKAEVERHLQVESDPHVEGSWHWIGDDKLRYRPKEYWKPGTKVTVHVRLQGIDAGGGVYGDEDRDVSFTIGRAVRSVVDVKALKMTVYIDGKAARTIPITAGKPGFETRNGIKVALEKHKVKHMDARTVGIEPGDPDYYSLDVKWAIRVTWSGEFVHGAEWSTAQQGRERVSHGCVGMNLKNAEWFFDQTSRGDIIEVVNSPTESTMELDNGFGDWNLRWEDWVAGSALSS
jgi:lipoprotein-anchoring transpeptidase ErfK/SrfK